MRFFRTGMGFLMVVLSGSLFAQTIDESRKNCSELPKVTYHAAQPMPPPGKDSVRAVIDILVDEKGRVREPKVITPSGSKEFDQDAISAVKQWRFKPALCDGKPTPTHISVSVESHLAK